MNKIRYPKAMQPKAISVPYTGPKDRRRDIVMDCQRGPYRLERLAWLSSLEDS
jgi:hypothetical protein